MQNTDPNTVKSEITKILLVEDDAIDAELMKRVLNRAGYHHVDISPTRERAKKFLEDSIRVRNPYSIVIVDLYLPKENGETDSSEGCNLVREIYDKRYVKRIWIEKEWTETAQAGYPIRRKERLEVACQIVVTNSPRGDHASQTERYSFCYITKPFSSKEILDAIQDIMAERAKQN